MRFRPRAREYVLVIFIIGKRYFSSYKKCHHQEDSFPDRHMEVYMGVKFPQKTAKKFSRSKNKAKCL